MKTEAQIKVVEYLTNSSPFLSEAAALLAQVSLPAVGLPVTDASREKAAVYTVRNEGVALAELVNLQAPVVSEAAPDLALAAPDFAVSASA